MIPPPTDLTLDLGCGGGRVGVVLRERGHRVVGVDLSRSLAELALETGAYDEVAVADAASLPFPDDRFDPVIAFMSLQDMDDAAGAVREAARVLASRRVEALRGPRPSEADIAASADLAKSRALPAFLHVRCRR